MARERRCEKRPEKSGEAGTREAGLMRALAWPLRPPRLARIAFVMFGALLSALILTPLATELHGRFFAASVGDTAPALAAMGLTFAMYIFGWLTLVGTRGEPPAPGFGLLVYLLLTLLILLAGLAWFIVNALPALTQG
jgi:hypothetical protein